MFFAGCALDFKLLQSIKVPEYSLMVHKQDTISVQALASHRDTERRIKCVLFQSNT